MGKMCSITILQFKKIIIPDLISVYSIVCDVKVIVEKAKIRSLQKLPDVQQFRIIENLFMVVFKISSQKPIDQKSLTLCGSIFM